MSAELVCNYLDAEIAVYESFQKACFKVNFGFERLKEQELSLPKLEGDFERVLAKKIGTERNSEKDFDRETLMKNGIVLKEKELLHGYCEVFKPVTSANKLKLKFFELAINFDFIPYFNFCLLDSLPLGKLRVSINIFAKSPLVSIEKYLMQFASLEHSFDRKNVSLVIKDLTFKYELGIPKIMLITSEESNPFQHIAVGNSEGHPQSNSYSSNVVEPQRKTPSFSIDNTLLINSLRNKENMVLINNLKTLINLTLKKDIPTPEKKTFKGKIFKVPFSRAERKRTNYALREERVMNRLPGTI